MRVRRHVDAAAFRRAAEPWLEQAEADNNLLLGLLPVLEGDEHGFQEPIYLATIEARGQVQGCAFRTPPYKLGVTRMPLQAVPLLIESLRDSETEVPGVIGPPVEARACAAAWAKVHGCSIRHGMQQRIHALETLLPPARATAGERRLARADEASVMASWSAAFAAEAEAQIGDPGAITRQLMARQQLHVWDRKGPRCMAAVMGLTRHGARIGLVYTPPRERRRGYATALVAALSLRELELGRRFCFLYTDTANPTSNRIYARLGYRPVCESMEVHID